ncbi:putative ATP-dependent helicase Lhr [Corynebacterium kalinowskii]|uniref:ATP-dependent helicase Lhr n=1 Tax=Corynebacterium kalinowskii TaxID=2675216 RepID=A0A6B8VSG5_9CORY|nr:ATP-dependent helicase [Corynebacterium kalinowskii]QGU02577.1 putative ATP-dependent helicase Lhr [Corynebacterium kalinowskii]
MTTNILDRFRPHVRTWFTDVFAAPTPVQEQAWEEISAGSHALVVAPTGSGKTLAAFLWAINSLVDQPEQPALPALIDAPLRPTRRGGKVKVLYISPLKALGVDVENNLRAPLLGISRVAARLEMAEPEVTVGVRSGDTPASERNRQLRTPPDILITTPESLYLMLTSKAAAILDEVHTVIIDEIHAMAGTKRGVHLSLTLERLAEVAGDFQRIGLSATVRPLERVAAFLGGDRPVSLIAPQSEKRWQLDVHVPVDDLSDLPTPDQGSPIGEAVLDDPHGFGGPTPAQESALPQQKSIWPFIEQELYQEIMAAQSTLVFVNSRRSAERLTSRLNELYAIEHDPAALSPELRRDPAQLMKSVDVAGKAPAIIARAHHGSVSKEERAQTEAALKAGELKCVVATSSLELGIDMGAVDLVVQVESPPSVASGLQRVGRAGHSVGAVSQGSFYPKHRADLVQSAVTVQRMRQGLIEELKVPQNALDVLLQQTVAAASISDVHVDTWYECVRRAYPYRDLPRDVFDAVIDLASGVYPSTDFAELKPRVVFDRTTGTLQGRPGAQRVAVTSGGTIPDRGMFGVFLVGSEGAPRRVGELDEEMVYESRVGDVFTLGATSWRIEDITRDQVLVSPAPGHTGRLPFWTGDQAGRPAELGRAVGAFRREVHANPGVATDLDERARNNLIAFLNEQEEATGIIPDEQTLVLERFRDELGDWRVVLHSPFGRGVNAAWALAVGARISETTGMDAQAVAGDDGIILRLPESDREPSADLFVFDADEIRDIVTEQVGNSALFASRFRECAARGLLLPRRNPGKRAPLWQQRQRAAQLLDVARKYPSFPIILETVRECLQDVYDLPELTQVQKDLGLRRIRIAEVTTEQPSPFASSLLFNYTGAFMYEGDSPLAEKRAAALALDPSLLAKLLGTVELRELLDQDVIAEIHAQLQRTTPDRRARTAEELADTLRLIGPIPVSDLENHTDVSLGAALDQLAGRVMVVRIAGRDHLAQSLDAPLLRDALGIPVPAGVSAQATVITDALAQLVNRYARSRGPFTVAELAEVFGLGHSTALAAIQGALSQKVLVEGHFRAGVEAMEYCAVEVLRRIRSLSLARARAEAEPVSTSAFARFLPEWLGVAPIGESPKLHGADGVFQVLEQLAGVRLPASAWEALILPSRISDYHQGMLDELTASGEIRILGAGVAAAKDPWIMLLPADYAAELAPEQHDAALSPLQEQVVEVLGKGGGFYFADLLAELDVPALEIRDALWSLVDAGLVTPDSFGAIRARLSGTSVKGAAHRASRRPTRGRLRMGRTSFAQSQQQGTPPDMLGRWSLAVTPSTDTTSRSVAHGEAWLDRYGVVTRGSIVAEDVLGGFALAYKVLSRFEENGKALRGYLIEGLGAAQFSTPSIVDRLRGLADSPDLSGWPSGADDPHCYVLAATDPANPYGAALPWPDTELRPTRAAGALVVLVDGLLLAHLGRGGRTLNLFFDELPDGVGESTEQLATRVVQALGAVISHGRMSRIVVEKINGESVFDTPMLGALKTAGASITPKGLRIGGQTVPARKPVTRTLEDISFDDPPPMSFGNPFGRRR